MLVLAGLPIAFIMLVLSGIYFLTGPAPGFIALLPTKIFEGMDVIILTAIPFFPAGG